MNHAKKPLKGNTKEPEDRLIQKSMRLNSADWAKVFRNGGRSWLRELVKNAPEKPGAAG